MSYVEPYRDGDVIMAPATANGTSPSGAPIVGIGWMPVRRGDPDWRKWNDYLNSKGDTETRVGRRPGGTTQEGR